MTRPAAGAWRPRWRRRFLLFLFAAAVWALLSCYPNPAVLVRNLLRYRHLPVEPDLERRLGWQLPSQPRQIEFFVDGLLVPAPDWKLYRVPWYVPTPAEAARALRGDCEAKTVLLASLLAGRHVPFEVRASLGHIWVDYPGRPSRAGESRELACLEGKGGRLGLHWPQRVSWAEVWASEREYLWEAMPFARKSLFLAGLLWLALGAVLLGGSRPEGELRSHWRIPGWDYLRRAAWLAAVALAVLALVPWQGFPARWSLADLWEALALSALVGGFIAWLTVLRSARAVAISPDGQQITVLSCLGPWRRQRVLAVAEIAHLHLEASPGGLRPWAVAAVLGNGERVVLLWERQEVAARAVLGHLGQALKRAMVVRFDGGERRVEPADLGRPRQGRTALAPAAGDLARPRGCDLVIEESPGRWVMRYPAAGGGSALLVGFALLPALLAAILTHALLRKPLVVLLWTGWVIAMAYLGLTVYIALMLRGEIVARLGQVRVEIEGGELRFHTAAGRVERVALGRIEAVESGRVGESPSIAVVAPDRVIHLRDLCLLEHRQWVRQMVEQAILKAVQADQTLPAT